MPGQSVSFLRFQQFLPNPPFISKMSSYSCFDGNLYNYFAALFVQRMEEEDYRECMNECLNDNDTMSAWIDEEMRKAIDNSNLVAAIVNSIKIDKLIKMIMDKIN